MTLTLLRRVLALVVGVGLAALAAPSVAAAGAVLRSVDLVPSETHPFASRRSVPRFNLVGVHWRGTGRVVFRTRSLHGGWTAWRSAAPEEEDAPDVRAHEGRRVGWRVGNPFSVAASRQIEARAVGHVSRVRAFLVWSPDVRVPFRVPAAADAPPVVPRLSWGADESIRRGQPSYAPDLRFAVVHHTAGRNDYSRSEAAAIVKGIQLYHVQGNGWNDIGYNFLVDRFGTVYEGRFGGVERNVVGAHAQGFNTGSVGVAVLGTYGSTAPSRAAQDAVARLLAWRLDLAHVDPTGLETFISGGNGRYAAGVPVLLGRVTGHRDTGFTECPGDLLHARLGSLAAAARTIGLPKVFAPRVETAEGTYRFLATLSSPQAWEVVVTSPAGVEVARGAGVGADVDWTWDATTAAAGTYSWTVAAGSARPATGSVRAGGAAPTLAIEAAGVERETISPNGDGQADTTILTYRLAAPANVTIELADEAGTVLATLVDRVWTGAGDHRLTITGDALSDGRYTIVVAAKSAAGSVVQKLVPLTVSRTLGVVGVTPAVFSPNDDGRNDRLGVTFVLAAAAEVRVRIERDGHWVASPFTGSLPPGPQRVVWNGIRPTGTLRDGSYEAIVEVTDGLGPSAFGLSFAADTTAPRLRILPGRGLRVQVSEPAVLRIRADGRSLRRVVQRAGVVRIPGAGSARRVRVVAWDAGGNASAPVVRIRPDG